MTVAVERDGVEVSDELNAMVATCMRDLMDWIYAQLRTEWEYLESDSTVADSLIANEYDFTEDGKIV